MFIYKQEGHYIIKVLIGHQLRLKALNEAIVSIALWRSLYKHYFNIQLLVCTQVFIELHYFITNRSNRKLSHNSLFAVYTKFRIVVRTSLVHVCEIIAWSLIPSKAEDNTATWKKKDRFWSRSNSTWCLKFIISSDFGEIYR